jgi:hypothetical protein
MDVDNLYIGYKYLFRPLPVLVNDLYDKLHDVVDGSWAIERYIRELL